MQDAPRPIDPLVPVEPTHYEEHVEQHPGHNPLHTITTPMGVTGYPRPEFEFIPGVATDVLPRFGYPDTEGLGQEIAGRLEALGHDIEHTLRWFGLSSVDIDAMTHIGPGEILLPFRPTSTILPFARATSAIAAARARSAIALETVNILEDIPLATIQLRTEARMFRTGIGYGAPPPPEITNQITHVALGMADTSHVYGLDLLRFAQERNAYAFHDWNALGLTNLPVPPMREEFANYFRSAILENPQRIMVHFNLEGVVNKRFFTNTTSERVVQELQAAWKTPYASGQVTRSEFIDILLHPQVLERTRFYYGNNLIWPRPWQIGF